VRLLLLLLLLGMSFGVGNVAIEGAAMGLRDRLEGPSLKERDEGCGMVVVDDEGVLAAVKRDEEE
jgi:hypothetical protein